jgi:hypothetical protein
MARDIFLAFAGTLAGILVTIFAIYLSDRTWRD